MSQLLTSSVKRLLVHSRNNRHYTSNSEIDRMKFTKDKTRTGSVKLLPKSKYGGENFVTLLTGSTLIGVQGGNYIKTLFDSAKVPVNFERITVGSNKTFPTEYLTSVLRNGTAIHVDLQHDPTEKHKSHLLNSELDLAVCVVKLRSYPGFKCRFPNADMHLVFQNNTGDFKKLEYEPVNGVVQTLRFCQDEDIIRFFNFAFQYAEKNCREKITIGHKAKELPLTDGQFLKIAHELRCSSYPHIELETMNVNKIVRHLIMDPERFDMICVSDRYGTFLTTIASAVCGGVSLFSCCEKGDHHAIFKPLQTKLSITGHRQLSPYGIVQACIDLLHHIGNECCANMMQKEMLHTMLDCNIRTKEFGGKNSGDFVICHIVNNMKCKFA